MEQESVLSLLMEAGEGYISGEAMSQRLGITRAAVWKQIAKLRQRGYVIEASTRLGYRLSAQPEPLEQERILELLGDHPFRQHMIVLDSVDSTNNYLKLLAGQGAPHGTIAIADEQTGGRGRQGRSFASPKGVGLYYSLLLRPDCAPAEASHLTAMVAVAVCDAIEAAAGVRPGIKWTNDIILNEKKLVGILTEMSAEWESGTLQYLVTGIGINCNHQLTDFPGVCAAPWPPVWHWSLGILWTAACWRRSLQKVLGMWQRRSFRESRHGWSGIGRIVSLLDGRCR